MSKGFKWIRLSVLAIVLSVVVALSVGYLALRASLPRMEGEVALMDLGARVTASRDALGIPVVTGETLTDVVRAQGFLHGQERFFQMDLSRRYAAGELAELVGRAAFSTDEEIRVFRHREIARRTLVSLTSERRQILEAYAAGVNAGLGDLGARPPEYWALGSKPAQWEPEDSILVSQLFFVMLSRGRRFERMLGVMKETLPNELYAFLTPDTTRLDAPLLGPRAGEAVGGYDPSPIPGPEVVDLRGTKALGPERDVVRTYGERLGGSNNWAIAGSRNEHGRAVLANDPHLLLTVPGTWYRIELKWGDRVVRGVSAPGLPGVVIGATDRLAWGFTNGWADHDDFVIVEIDPDDPSRYLTPDGYEPFEKITELIRISGGETKSLTIRQTRWGPVVGEDPLGRLLALKSTAHDPRTANMNAFDLLLADTIEQAVEIIRGWYSAAQNVVLADTKGRIAWVLSGYFPRRVGFDGTVPVSWADGGAYWDGGLDESLRPVSVDPPEGILFTANGRTVAPDPGRKIAHVWESPARANRIAEMLRSRETFDERGLLAMQLDTRSKPHELARDLLLEVVTDEESAPSLRRAGSIVESWNGTADADQPGFRILREYQMALREAVVAPLLTPCVEADQDFVYNWPLVDESLARILEERPPHLLPPGYASWQDLLRTALVETVRRIEDDPSISGLDTPWGLSNRAAIQHPLARAVPALRRVLNMPPDPMPGHSSTVRMHVPGVGASMRMVVSPGNQEAGILHMPCGQSGHFLSRHYDDAHAAWVQGSPTPFLAGAPVSTITFISGS